MANPSSKLLLMAKICSLKRVRLYGYVPMGISILVATDCKDSTSHSAVKVDFFY